MIRVKVPMLDTDLKIIEPEYGRTKRIQGKYNSIILKWAKYYNIDPIVIKKVILIESNFSSKRVSKAGAMGLMQVMPFHFKSFGVSKKLGFHPEINIIVGTAILRDTYNKLTKIVKDRKRCFYLTLAAYNSGPTFTTRLIQKHGEVDALKHLPKETIRYIRKYKGL
ncbi:MAG: transglycosylase SLT domain-containing protein [Nitrospirota bacterium]